jgi:hypothetical protein
LRGHRVSGWHSRHSSVTVDFADLYFFLTDIYATNYFAPCHNVMNPQIAAISTLNFNNGKPVTRSNYKKMQTIFRK